MYVQVIMTIKFLGINHRLFLSGYKWLSGGIGVSRFYPASYVGEREKEYVKIRLMLLVVASWLRRMFG